MPTDVFRNFIIVTHIYQDCFGKKYFSHKYNKQIPLFLSPLPNPWVLFLFCLLVFLFFNWAYICENVLKCFLKYSHLFGGKKKSVSVLEKEILM